MVVAHAFNPNTQQVDLCEFDTSLVYRLSFSIAKATDRNPCLENKIKQNNHNKNHFSLWVLQFFKQNAEIWKHLVSTAISWKRYDVFASILGTNGIKSALVSTASPNSKQDAT